MESNKIKFSSIKTIFWWVFFEIYLFYLKVKITRKKKKTERGTHTERKKELFHPLLLSPDSHHGQSWVDQKLGNRLLSNLPCGCTDPGFGPPFLLSQASSRGLGSKWSNQDSKWNPPEMPTLQVERLSLVCYCTSSQITLSERLHAMCPLFPHSAAPDWKSRSSD